MHAHSNYKAKITRCFTNRGNFKQKGFGIKTDRRALRYSVSDSYYTW